MMQPSALSLQPSGKATSKAISPRIVFSLPRAYAEGQMDADSEPLFTTEALSHRGVRAVQKSPIEMPLLATSN
jgi:hypothetical protein